jgi:hypothetical protein
MESAEVTLPSDREVLGIVDLAFKAYTEGPCLALVITDSHEHVRWLISKLHSATGWDSRDKVRLFREGIETSGGATILIRTWGHPEGLMGLRPDKIILMGRLGELYYHLNSMGGEIEVIA